MSDIFPATLAAAQQRIAAIRPAAYASSRNHLGGAVTRLSPYLAHGIVSLTEVAAAVAARHSLPLQHKLVQELGWRQFFHHVARHLGEGILQSLHAGPRPEAAYQANLPDDVHHAHTGVPVVDAAVRQLYATGWLHNHARLWLASYLVHVRGVHWRAGADWLLAHLIDGDRASNHLSWQWIAGTCSHKPYLFNADNVARYTGPDFADWASPGSVLDTDYGMLQRWAHGQAPLPAAMRLPAALGIDAPTLWHSPPPGIAATADLSAIGTRADLSAIGSSVAGRPVLLVHPWALGEPAADADPRLLRLGVWPAEHFAAWPWSARRWAFVAARLQQVSQQQVWADGVQLQQALANAASVHTADHPELPATWPAAWRRPTAQLLPEPACLCSSFSQFWRQATRGLQCLEDLPGWPQPAQQALF